jgi:hypothetical protein
MRKIYVAHGAMVIECNGKLTIGKNNGTGHPVIIYRILVEVGPRPTLSHNIWYTSKLCLGV